MDGYGLICGLIAMWFAIAIPVVVLRWRDDPWVVRLPLLRPEKEKRRD